MWPLLSTKVKEKKQKKPHKNNLKQQKTPNLLAAVAIFSNNKVVHGWSDKKWEGKGQNTSEKYLRKGFSL